MTQKWDTYFIKMADLVASKSKDDSTKVGCIIVSDDNTVLSMGYNGFPRGVQEIAYKICEKCFGVGMDKYRGVPQWMCEDCGGTGMVENGLIEDRWHKRPEKYQWVEHAERNAIYNAARKGIRLEGSIAYLNWEPVPCSDCARALIQAGIVEIVGPDIPFGGAGAGKHYHVDEISKTMLKEAKVRIRTIKLEE